MFYLCISLTLVFTRSLHYVYVSGLVCSMLRRMEIIMVGPGDGKCVTVSTVYCGPVAVPPPDDGLCTAVKCDHPFVKPYTRLECGRLADQLEAEQDAVSSQGSKAWGGPIPSHIRPVSGPPDITELVCFIFSLFLACPSRCCGFIFHPRVPHAVCFACRVFPCPKVSTP